MENIVPLGDQAALIYFSDETSALQFAAQVRKENPSWLVDVVQAYTSVWIYFDLNRITFSQVKQFFAAAGSWDQGGEIFCHSHVIPCCYDFELDMKRISEQVHLPPEQIIYLHTQKEYTVYAIGFCPGFPYLGYLPDELSGVRRLENPRLKVEVGSVGLTGKQTGIYTQESPGGWNIVGRTPLQLVDIEDEYFPLQTGDRVRFRRIDAKEFKALMGERL